MRDLRNLTSYCGLYCPGCTRFESRLAEQEFNYPAIPDKYNVFREGESPARDQTSVAGDRFDSAPGGLAGNYQSCRGCKEGEGKKDCHVRSCASDRGYSTCVECIRMENCDVLKGNPMALRSLREIRDKGYDNWLKTKEEMVKAGWTFAIDFDGVRRSPS